MEERLKELLTAAYAVSEADAQRMLDELKDNGATVDDFEVLVGIYEDVNTTGTPPAGLEAQFQTINAELQSWVQANATTEKLPRRQQVRQKFDEFVASNFTQELTPEERALLDQVFADAFSLFNASGRGDEDFQQFIDDSFNRLVSQASLEQEEAAANIAEQQQRQIEDQWRGRALRMLQATGLPPEAILPALDDTIDALRGVQASGQDLTIGEGVEAALANRLFQDTVIDVVEQYETAIQNQQAAKGELLPPSPPGAGLPTPTAQNTVVPGSQAEAFVQQQVTGLTAEQQAQQQANLADDLDTSTPFGEIAAGLDPAFAATLSEEQLRTEFQARERQKAETLASISTFQSAAAGKMGGQVPGAGDFAPSSFSDFLSRRTTELEDDFRKNRAGRGATRKAGSQSVRFG